MRIYRCYFLNERGGIDGYEHIEAHALDEAIDRALALLRQQPKHKAMRFGKDLTGSLARRKTARVVSGPDL